MCNLDVNLDVKLVSTVAVVLGLACMYILALLKINQILKTPFDDKVEIKPYQVVMFITGGVMVLAGVTGIFLG